MVGHLLLYHPAYKKLKEEIDKGTIGRLRYIYSNRLSLGNLEKKKMFYGPLLLMIFL